MNQNLLGNTTKIISILRTQNSQKRVLPHNVTECMFQLTKKNQMTGITEHVFWYQENELIYAAPIAETERTCTTALYSF